MKKTSNKFISDLNVLNIGLTSGICIAISLFIGHQVDLYFSIRPWGIVSGIVIGLGASILEIWTQVSRQLKELEQEDEYKNRDPKT